MSRLSSYVWPGPRAEALKLAERVLFFDPLVPCTRSLTDLILGRLALKTLSKKVRKELSRVDQRHRASQLRKQKKEAVRGARIGEWCDFTSVLGG